MVGQGSEGFKLSWADEVEREEQEEEIAQSRSQHKPDPFGSARPREVVLQERGIDWRILEQHHVKNRFNEKPPVPVSHRNQIPLTFVPPVRHPYKSKNGVANWVAKPHTYRKKCFDSEKENMFHKHEKSYPRRDENPDFCQEPSHIESKEYKNQRNVGSRQKRTEPINRKNSVSSPLVSEEIDRELDVLEQQRDKEVQLVCETEMKSEKPGQCSAKTKRSRRKRRRRKNTASNESGTGFQELCNCIIPSCAPQVTKMKKTGFGQKYRKRGGSEQTKQER